MMSLWDALRMNMMISYQELVRTFPGIQGNGMSTGPFPIAQQTIVPVHILCRIKRMGQPEQIILLK